MMEQYEIPQWFYSHLKNNLKGNLKISFKNSTKKNQETCLYESNVASF